MDHAEKTVSKVVKHLQKIREKRGISAYRIAQDTGLSATGIRAMETGKVTPTLYFILRIAEYLETDISGVIARPIKVQRVRKKTGDSSL